MMNTVEGDMSNMPMPAAQAVEEALVALERNKPYVVPGMMKRTLLPPSQ